MPGKSKPTARGRGFRRSGRRGTPPRRQVPPGVAARVAARGGQPIIVKETVGAQLREHFKNRRHELRTERREEGISRRQQWQRTWLWRHRVALFPYTIMTGMWAVALTMHLVGGIARTLWPAWTGATLLTVAALLWDHRDGDGNRTRLATRLEQWRVNRLRIRNKRRRMYAIGLVAGTGAWLSQAVALGPAGHYSTSGLYGLGTLAAIPWWYDRRIRSRVQHQYTLKQVIWRFLKGESHREEKDRRRREKAMKRQVANWSEYMANEAVKLPGSKLSQAKLLDLAWQAVWTLPKGKTIDDAVKAIAALESVLGCWVGSIRVEPITNGDGKKMSNKVRLTVYDKDPHSSDLTPPEWAPKSRTVRDLLPLGYWEDGSPMERPVRNVHGGIFGMSGSGKSGGINALVYGLASCDDTVLLGIDLKHGLELGPWRPVMYRVVDTPAAATELLRRVAEEAMPATGRKMAAAGIRERHATPDDPQYCIIVDEFRALPEEAKKYAGVILTQGRALGWTLEFATQYPVKEVVDPEQKAQLSVTTCFRLRSAGHCEVAIGEGMRSQGWTAHMLPVDRPGTNYLLSPGNDLPRIGRHWYLNDEFIKRKATEFAEAGRPQPDGIVAAALGPAIPGLLDEPLFGDQAEPTRRQGADGPQTIRTLTLVKDDIDSGGELDLLREAVEIVVSTQYGSLTMLQRKLRLRYDHACKLMDRLEELGVVGPADGDKARDVLVKPDDLPALLTRLAQPGTSAPRPTSMVDEDSPLAAQQRVEKALLDAGTIGLQFNEAIKVAKRGHNATHQILLKLGAVKSRRRGRWLHPTHAGDAETGR